MNHADHSRRPSTAVHTPCTVHASAAFCRAPLTWRVCTVYVPCAGETDGVGTSVKFTAPTAVCLARNGRMAFTVENTYGQIRVLDLDTKEVRKIAGYRRDSVDGIHYDAEFYYPTDCAATEDGSIVYVVEGFTSSRGGKIRKVVVDTSVVTTIAGPPFGDLNPIGSDDGPAPNATFNEPRGIALAPSGAQAFVTEYGGNVVRQIDLASGMVSTLAGTGTAGFADGAGVSAEFDKPNHIAIRPDGASLYVADGGNRRVRQIDVATRVVRFSRSIFSSPPSLPRSAPLSASLSATLWRAHARR